jgi:ABC-type nitrate/sulfonate/bicarbonate transport system permease component
MKNVAEISWRVASVGVALLFIGIWQLVANAHIVSPVFLPGPDRAWHALVSGFADGSLTGDLASTVEHVFYGWLIASILGIAFGAVLGSSQTLRPYVQPLLEFLRPLPPSALIPLSIALFGLSEGTIVGVIALGAFFPTLLSTMYGFSAVQPRLYEVAQVLGLSRTSVILKIALPSSLPAILAGMRMSLTVALILAIVGEMLTGRSGLGASILQASRSFRSPELYAGVIVLGLLGYASAQILSIAEHRLLGWRHAQR